MGRAAGVICGCPRGARRFCLPCQREVAERSEAGGIALWQLPFERGAVTEGLPYGGLALLSGGISRQGNPPISALAPPFNKGACWGARRRGVPGRRLLLRHETKKARRYTAGFSVWRSIRDLNSGGAVNALSHFECCRLCIPSTNLVELGGSSWKSLFPFPRQILTHFPPKMEVQRPYLNPTQFFRFCSKNTPFLPEGKN